MSVLDKLKQILRMCGHAIVITVHERLDAIQQRMNDISEQNTSLARTQTALLQSSLHVIEALQPMQAGEGSIPNAVVNAYMQRLDDLRNEQAAMREQIRAVERQLKDVLAALAEPGASHASVGRIAQQQSRKHHVRE